MAAQLGRRASSPSLIELGTDEFARIRLGIGRPPGQMQAPDFVLQKFSGSDLVIIKETMGRGVEAVLTFISEGMDAAMNKYNGIGSQG